MEAPTLPKYMMMLGQERGSFPGECLPCPFVEQAARIIISPFSREEEIDVEYQKLLNFKLEEEAREK